MYLVMRIFLSCLPLDCQSANQSATCAPTAEDISHTTCQHPGADRRVDLATGASQFSSCLSYPSQLPHSVPRNKRSRHAVGISKQLQGKKTMRYICEPTGKHEGHEGERQPSTPTHTMGRCLHEALSITRRTTWIQLIPTSHTRANAENQERLS